MPAILEAFELTKRFGALEALHDVSFSLAEKEVLGIAGLSGSGKSILAQIIAGLVEPSSGSLAYQKERMSWPFRPQRFGLDVIHQSPLLVESLSIVNNIYLGHEILYPFWGRYLRMPNQAQMDKEATKLLAEFGVSFPNLEQAVNNLSNEQRQIVAIVRAMVRPSKIIFVDEPTNLLSYSQQQKLLSLIQFWQKQGKSILFSSTNLEHLFAVTDRILVLRQGHVAACMRTDETSREAVVAAMVGQPNQEHLTPVIWALDSYYRAREKADHLYQQATVLEKDLVKQDTLNQRLLSQLAKQVKALDQANAALQDAHRRLLTEREEERKHLARELHDLVLQDLLSTNYELEGIEAQVDLLPHYQEQLAQIRNSIRSLVEDVRGICGDLRPPTIDSLGLAAAIQSHAKEWSKRTGIRVMLSLDSTLGRLPEATELSIFRIIQEGLNNISHHADATEVSIELKHTSPRSLMLSMSDNGDGIPEEFDLAKLSAQGHYGLLGISERVALLNGHLRLQNRSEGGLLIQAEVPHPRVETPVDFPFDMIHRP
jgi:signal transduction histidine kinase